MGAPAGTLSRTAGSGVKWNFASQAGQQVTQLLTTVVLARLLAPEWTALAKRLSLQVQRSALAPTRAPRRQR